MKRKIGALLLVLAMIAAYMPTFAFAETEAEDKLIMFERANELEEGGKYLIISGTAEGSTFAMMNDNGQLSVLPVALAGDRVIFIEKDAQEKHVVFSVSEFTPKEKHSTGKLYNGDYYLSGTKQELDLRAGATNGVLFNTWDYPAETLNYQLCGLERRVRYNSSNSEWNANGQGTVTAIYKQVETATVTFDTDGHGTVDPESAFLKKGDKVEAPDIIPEDGYLFMGWYNGNEEWNFNTPVTEDITLVAKWDKAVKYELVNELEEDGEYIIVNRNSDNNDARVMQAVDSDLNYFNASVNENREVIIGEKQSENSLFKASDYYEDGDLKKAKLSLGDKYIGKNNDDRLVLVDEKDGGIFNTWNYDDGYKLCGYGCWIRCTGNNTGQRDGGWWPTNKWGDGYTGAYLYKKVSYNAVITADDKSKLCTEEDPELTATVSGDDEFAYDFDYALERAEGTKCGTYEITVKGDAKQGNYDVEYKNGTLTIKHVLKKVEGLEPTAEKSGYRYAYKCVGCGEYFEDETGTKPIGNQAAYDKWISKGGAGYLEKTPKTGDDNNIIFYGLTAILALLGAGSVYGFRRREHR